VFGELLTLRQQPRELGGGVAQLSECIGLFGSGCRAPGIVPPVIV